jgi:hypothetical protein
LQESLVASKADDLAQAEIRGVFMAEIINLRQARKARARTQAEDRAAQNRITHGRAKADRLATAARNDQDARRLAAHQLEKKPGPGVSDT